MPRGTDDPDLKAGKVRIGYRVKYALPDAPPFYVAVVVKPQHEVDENGRSTAVSDNRQLGFVAKARDLYEGDELEWKYVTYPDDFSMQLNGKTVKAPPLSQDPGAGRWCSGTPLRIRSTRASCAEALTAGHKRDESDT